MLLREKRGDTREGREKRKREENDGSEERREERREEIEMKRDRKIDRQKDRQSTREEKAESPSVCAFRTPPCIPRKRPHYWSCVGEPVEARR